MPVRGAGEIVPVSGMPVCRTRAPVLVLLAVGVRTHSRMPAHAHTTQIIESCQELNTATSPVGTSTTAKDAATKPAAAAAATTKTASALDASGSAHTDGNPRIDMIEKQVMKCETCAYTWESSQSEVDCVPIVHF